LAHFPVYKVIRNDGEDIGTPEWFGLNRVKETAIAGGNSVAESAQIFLNILQNQGSAAHQQVVLANAAMALYTGKWAKSVKEAYDLAKESLASGKAYESFKKLIALTI
jgi:anthranilate phosphoribosyltransferase